MDKESPIITQFGTHESPTHITTMIISKVMEAVSLIMVHNIFIRKATVNYKQCYIKYTSQMALTTIGQYSFSETAD